MMMVMKILIEKKITMIFNSNNSYYNDEKKSRKIK